VKGNRLESNVFFISWNTKQTEANYFNLSQEFMQKPRAVWDKWVREEKRSWRC
jgi:hypothetical protein